MGGQCGNRGKGRVTALPDFHRGKALLLFLEFLFIILNQVSEIDGKERKHDDADQSILVGGKELRQLLVGQGNLSSSLN